MSVEENSLLNHSCNILSRKQKRRLYFDYGMGSFIKGNAIVGNESGATAIVDSLTVSAGDWNAGTAKGYMDLTNITGTFSTDETLHDIDNVNLMAIATGADIPAVSNLKAPLYYYERTSISKCRIYMPNYSDNPENKVHTYKGEADPYRMIFCLPPASKVERYVNRLNTAQAGFEGDYGIIDVKPQTDEDGKLYCYEVLAQKVITDG
jgi:hypothetical protein